MKVIIGTKNLGKIEAAKQAFEQYFENIEIQGIAVDSEIGNQPVNKEILEGAKNRVKNAKREAKKRNLEADYYIAVEGGITNSLGEWINIELAVIENAEGFQSIGASQGFPIPEKYLEEIKKTELGKVMTKIFNDSEENKGKGAVSTLTKNKTARIDLTRNAFIMALTKHINEDKWK